MVRSPISLNLARIVYRLLTSHRGWRVRDLMGQLGIAERTYRKYRLVLQEEFEPLQNSDGTSRICEIGQGEERWLRIGSSEERAVTQTDFPLLVAAVSFARQALSPLNGTPIGRALDDLVAEYKHHVKDRQFIVGHLLRNADRCFRLVPEPCEDNSRKSEIVDVLVKALVFHHRVDLDYHSSQDRSRRLVLEPLTLVLQHGTIHLLARTPDDHSLGAYSVSLVQRAALRSDRFDYPPLSVYQPDHHIEGFFGLLGDTPPRVTPVVLVFLADDRLKRYLLGRCWHPTQRFEELPDGRLRMSFQVRTMASVWPWIRSFGTDVEVIRPSGPVPRSMTEDDSPAKPREKRWSPVAFSSRIRVKARP
ncbi:MAG: WYL domain-containing protein [Bradymonadales bacterium]|nr:WYL domain-containing protein [Bradymonadales bacterium]